MAGEDNVGVTTASTTTTEIATTIVPSISTTTVTGQPIPTQVTYVTGTTMSTVVSPERREARIAAISTLFATIVKDIRSIRDQGALALNTPGQVNLFRGMYRSLDRYYSKFEMLWEEYVEIMVELQRNIPIKESTYAETIKRYVHEVNSAYESLESKVTPNLPQGTCEHNNTTTIIDGRHYHLPKLEIAPFHGDIQEWAYFRDTFKALIHDDTTLPNVVKFHFLHSKVKGRARDVIKHLPKQDASYELAWNALMKAFDKKRLLAISYLDKVLDFKKSKDKANAQSLQSFLSEISESVEAFRLLDIPEASEFILFYLAVRNLDDKTRESFELEYVHVDYPTFENLSDFVKKHCQAFEVMAKPGTSSVNTEKLKPTNKPKAIMLTNKRSSDTATNQNSGLSSHSKDYSSKSQSSKTNFPPCPACSSNHRLYNCEKFMSFSPHERHELLKDWQGCRNCLVELHSTKNCRSAWHCRFCKARHHSSLHLSQKPRHGETSNKDGTSTQTSNNSTDSQNGVACVAQKTSSLSDHYEVVLGTAISHILDVHNKPYPIRILVDSGSHYSAITEDAVKALGLKIKPFKGNISTLGGATFNGVKGVVTCQLRSRIKPYTSLSCRALVLEQVTSDLPTRDLPEEVWHKFISYELADPTFWESNPVSFLLGGDLIADLWTGASITVDPQEPKLFPSVFGYVVCGKSVNSFKDDNKVVLLTVDKNPEEDIKSLIKKLWEIEEPVSHNFTNPEDEQCENHFKTTHYRLENGRYCVQLPFKQSDVILTDFEGVALKRFYSLENKLNRNPELKTLYHAFMREYISLGHMSVATEPAKYVIPHHCVSKVDRGEVKLRVVFDGSAKCKEGSLNDFLMAGPKLQNNVCDIMINFRVHSVAIVCDLVKMFRQIVVNDIHQPYQQIFWRFSQDDPIQLYQLHTVTYGLVSSPYQAIRVLLKMAEDEGRHFPELVRIITEDSYVDDFATGADSISSARALVSQFIAFFERGGFKVGKWASNKPEIFDSDTSSPTADPISLEIKDDFGIKVLGLQWCPSEDNFTFKICLPDAVSTKRAILSCVAKIFDPLGYLSPVVLLAKSIVQELWKSGLEWDDQIPEDVSATWKRVVGEMNLLSDIKIPRYTGLDRSVHAQLVGFSDASEKGYCAAIYLRIMIDNNINSYLIKAKTRLAPIKVLSIPRLELCGALLLAKTLDSIPSRFKTNITYPTYLFTDSSVVLAWIRTPPYKLKTFVSHRVAEITELTSISAWRHVKSADNPADCGSRGMLPSQLVNFDLWWHGPQWLMHHDFSFKDLEDSYSQPENLLELKEVSSVALVSTSDKNMKESWLKHIIHDWISRFSSYYRMIRSFCVVLRFINFISKKSFNSGFFTVAEIRTAEAKLITCIQRYYFFDCGEPDINALPKQFQCLSPFLDSSGVVRVGGRLEYSQIPDTQKHPILLPTKCLFIELIISHYHKLFLHPSHNLLQALIQTRYWVTSLRGIVRKVSRQCESCHRMRAQPYTPIMGNLPECRFKTGPAFSHVGIDYAGPFPIRESLRRRAPITKGYLAVFVCLSTKSVHLEAVSRLTTEAFLATFDRFVSRRGLPEQVFTDCGSNFIGAAKELKVFSNWANLKANQKQIHEYALKREVKWCFNPPSAPHFGGIWESAVREAKRLLYKVYGNKPMTFEELSTLFAKIEAVLNSRPLCPVSDDPNDFSYLSPGHILTGSPLVSAPEPSLVNVNENRLNRWQAVSQKHQLFWARWKNEYLTTLQRRVKWTNNSRNIRIGEMVLLMEPDSDPLNWTIGRVIETHPGGDGIVRVVTIRTPTSVFKRPVAKLAPLLPQDPRHEDSVLTQDQQDLNNSSSVNFSQIGGRNVPSE